MRKILKVIISVILMIVSLIFIGAIIVRGNAEVISINDKSEVIEDESKNNENIEVLSEDFFSNDESEDNSENYVEDQEIKTNYTFPAVIGVFIDSFVFMGSLCYLVLTLTGKEHIFTNKEFVKIYFVCTLLLAIVFTIFVLYLSKHNSKITNFIHTVNSEIKYSSTRDLHINNDNWNYDEENDIYWQIGLVYCSNPVDVKYESMGIYVPGEYFNGTLNDKNKYTVTLNNNAVINGYTIDTAPILLPVNTPEYSSQLAPTEYKSNGLKDFIDNGYIFVYAGCRGKNNRESYSGGAPWGVTDLKAAIRYIKYNDDTLPGNSNSIFVFGKNGGGAQAAVLGTSGGTGSGTDDLYTPYLKEIGAIIYDDDKNNIIDDVSGVLAWNPITSLDYANEAYEWMMGQYVDTGTRKEKTWTKELSLDLASAYGLYINELGLKDANGKDLKLKADKTFDKRYSTGTYADYILEVINKSLNNYLKDNFETSEEKKEYIEELNGKKEWIKYNNYSEMATISSIKNFVINQKNVTKDVGAFDSLEKNTTENYLFGSHIKDNLHWDTTLAYLLSDNELLYAEFKDFNKNIINDYNNDIKEKDSLGYSTFYRQNMYNPMYYINKSYPGYGSSIVAKYWRIRSGINQGDTALTVETNLYLCLNQLDSVDYLDFETVWGKGHTMAERTGTPIENLINYIEECLSDIKTTVSDHQITEEILKVNKDFNINNYNILRKVDEIIENDDETQEITEVIDVMLKLGDFVTNSGYKLTVTDGEVLDVEEENILTKTEINTLKEKDKFKTSNYDDELNDIYDKFYKKYDSDIEKERYYYDVVKDKLYVELFYKSTSNKITSMKSISYEIKKNDKKSEKDNTVSTNSTNTVKSNKSTNKTNVTNNTTTSSNITNEVSENTNSSSVQNIVTEQVNKVEKEETNNTTLNETQNQSENENNNSVENNNVGEENTDNTIEQDGENN